MALLSREDYLFCEVQKVVIGILQLNEGTKPTCVSCDLFLPGEVQLEDFRAKILDFGTLPLQTRICSPDTTVGFLENINIIELCTDVVTPKSGTASTAYKKFGMPLLAKLAENTKFDGVIVRALLRMADCDSKASRFGSLSYYLRKCHAGIS